MPVFHHDNVHVKYRKVLRKAKTLPLLLLIIDCLKKSSNVIIITQNNDSMSAQVTYRVSPILKSEIRKIFTDL